MSVSSGFIANGEVLRDFASDSSAPTTLGESAGTLADLNFHASGFVVSVEGVWSHNALAPFRDFLSLQHLSPMDEELHCSLIYKSITMRRRAA